MAQLERRLARLERGQGADVYDLAGNLLLGDDAVSGQGLTRPYIPLPMLPASTAMDVTTTSAVFVDLWVGVIYKQHPLVLAYPLVRASDATTSGELQLYDATGAAVLVNPVVVGLGFSGYKLLGPVALPGGHLAARTISLQARRTAGAGTIGGRLACCYGLGN